MAAKKSSTNVVPFAVTDWPADRVEKWPLEKIKPYPNNPRTHPPEQIALLAASMMDDGVTMPILVDEQGIIIAGHGRHLAAQQNKFHDYPVVIARGWSETKKRASRVRDNQMGLLSRWDDILLRAEVGELKVEDYDLKLLGFGDGELYALSLDIERGEADPLLEWSGMPEFD
jgi:ParB-like chromosome segregation protein Spo0J